MIHIFKGPDAPLVHFGQTDQIVSLGALAKESGYRLGALARKLKLTKRRLIREISESLELPAIPWIRELRYQHICSALISDEKLQTIATEHGFSSYSGFYDEVLRVSGMSPKLLQNSLREAQKKIIERRYLEQRTKNPEKRNV